MTNGALPTASPSRTIAHALVVVDMARLPLSELRTKIGQAIEQKRYDDAVAVARVILEAYPKSVQARRMLAEALWESGRPDEAADAFRQVLELDPEDFVAYAGLGLIAEQQGNIDNAIAQLQRATEQAPNSEEVRGELVRLYEKRGSADSARLKISRAALGRIYARGEMPSRAVAEFRAVLDEQPNRHDVRMAQAEVLWRLGEAEEARRAAETVLQYLPGCLKAHLLLATIAAKQGREHNAQQLLAEAAAMDPMGEFAERLLGTDSPLPPADPLIEVPDYLLGEAQAPQAAVDLDIELPDWLRDEPEVEAEEPPQPAAAAAEAPRPLDAGLDWLQDLRRATEEPRPPEPAAAGAPPPDADGDADAGAAWQAYQDGDLATSLAVYGRLIEAERDLEDITQALTVIVADTGDIDATELLGDAYMRSGQYRAAMDSYRLVLERLQQEDH